MRKPRDYAADLQALDRRTKDLKDRTVRQLGELVIATGAAALDTEMLAGGLLAMTELGDVDRKETLRTRGAAFFRGRPRKAGRELGGDEAGGTPRDGDAAAG